MEINYYFVVAVGLFFGIVLPAYGIYNLEKSTDRALRRNQKIKQRKDKE